MPDISKINALAIGSVAKVDGLATSSILDIDGVAVPAAVAPPLDTYTGASAAYSIRLLRTAYTGPIMRVRRASDNVEADVGFDSNNEFGLTSPISNTSDAQSYTDFGDFVDHTGTPTSAFVRYWYDQSGNANDAGQSTAANQPKIYDATNGLIKDGSAGNEKPAVEFDGSGDILINTAVQNSFEGAAQAFTMLHVAQTDDVSSFQYTFSLLDGTNSTLAQNDQLGILTTDNNNSGVFIRDYSTTTTSLPKSSSVVGTAQHLNTAVNTGSTLSVYLDGTAGDSVSVNYPALAFDYASIGGRYGGSTPSSDTLWNGKIQEVLVYASDQSSNRTGIESNINTYFSIY